jgi:hypothetical protein
MKPTKVSLEKTINPGFYESIRLGVEVEIQDGDTVAGAFEKIKTAIDAEAAKLIEENKKVKRGPRGERI